MHMHRAKYQPNGGPDGGDGGRGGNVYLRGNHNYWTLLHLRYERHVFAGNGGNGSKCCSHGSDGEDRYIDVPPGTVAYDAETGKLLVSVNPQWFRPTDVDNLWGDPTKAKTVLGWNPQKTSYQELVNIMAKHDRERAKREKALKAVL